MAAFDISSPSVSISIPVPGPAAPAPRPKPAPQPAPAPAPAPPAAPAPAPEPSPRAFIFPFAPAPRRRMARGRPSRYAMGSAGEEEGFHKSIQEDPGNYLTHGVYADWLDDHGRHAQAGLIRSILEGHPAKSDSHEEWTKSRGESFIPPPVVHFQPENFYNRKPHQTAGVGYANPYPGRSPSGSDDMIYWQTPLAHDPSTTMVYNWWVPREETIRRMREFQAEGVPVQRDLHINRIPELAEKAATPDRMARGKPRRYAHSDEPAMHAAIAANPQDNTAGHAYSDMLEENGKPAHAEVVRSYIKRTGQPAMVRRRGMLDWTADPDIPWETGVMAGPVGHLEPADRDYQTDPITEQEPGWWRVHLFRRTPDRRILHWTANVNGREHAAALVRRLHAEGQQSVPPGGEVLLDANAGNFVNHPARYQRLARRTLTVQPHAEPESVARPTRRQILLSLKRAGRNGATTPNRP